jgi:hypothetical protein
LVFKPVGGIMDLKHAVVCADNNRIGRMPDLLIGTDKFLHYIRKKQDRTYNKK